MKFRLVPLAAMVACSLVLSACSMRMPHVWPFYKKPKVGPQAVNELNLVNADGSAATYPQYWKRNTLVIDLSGVSGTGGFAARLPEETTWPVRVAVRVRPGSVQQLEIQGEERNVLPVAPEGALPIDLEFAPSVYRPRTAAIYISWGSMPVFAEVAVAPESPAFVSPTEVPKTAPAPEAPAPSIDTAGDPAAPTASDIVPPAEVVPRN
ncbi:MAG: hypothetical protein WDO72_15750 [Pseudomonadota bacterium]